MPEFPRTDDLDRTKQQIRELVTEIAQLARGDLEPRQFYTEYLQRVVAALAAQGGAVWILERGNLRLEYQLNMPPAVDPRQNAGGGQSAHSQLLLHTLTNGGAAAIPPQSGIFGDGEGGLANPTDSLLLLGGLSVNREPAGIIEIFQRPNARPAAQQGYVQFLRQMCALASDFLKNRKLRSMADRQHLWAQLETFSEEIHRTLELKAVTYTVANEGRRIIESDRVSVVLRHGRRSLVEAISGQDVVDRRANLVRTMGRLADAVIRSGEPLRYYGSTEELAPSLEKLITEYVDESGSKSIIIEPLKPPVEGTEEPVCLGAVVVERIEDARPDPAMVDRVEVVTRHSTPALKNALEHHRVFLLPVWQALGNRAAALRGRKLAKVGVVLGVIALLIGSLFVIPWRFRPQAKGELLPKHRAHVFAPPLAGAQIHRVHVRQGQRVKKGDLVIELNQHELPVRLKEAHAEHGQTLAQIQRIRSQMNEVRAPTVADTVRLQGEWQVLETQAGGLHETIRLLEEQMKLLKLYAPQDGLVTTWNVEQLLSPERPVNPGDLLLEIVDDSGDWIAEIRLPEERMGHVLQAQAKLGANEPIPVEFVLASRPEQSHKGKITHIGSRARVTQDEGNVVAMILEPDAETIARLRPEAAVFAVAGAEVRAKIDCGPRSLGFVLFVDVIEFIQGRILF